MRVSKPLLVFLLIALAASCGLNLWFLSRRPSATPAAVTPSAPARAGSASSRAVSPSEPVRSPDEFKKWIRRSPRAALQWAESSVEGEANRELVLAGVRQWAKDAPAAAAEWVYAMAPGEAREAAIAELLEQWALSDAPAAVRWFSGLRDGPQPISSEGWFSAASRLAESWAVHAPAAAVAWADAFAQKHEETEPFSLAMTAWGRSASDAALAYFNSIADASPLRAVAAAALGEGMIVASPENALRWALSLGDDDTGWQARHAVFERWSALAPSAAAQHVARVTDADERADHIQTLVHNWSQTNIDAAEAWTNSLPVGHDRDQALRALADAYVTLSPEKALSLGLAIASHEVRMEILDGLLSWWREDAPAKAGQWLATAPIDDDLRRRLTSRPEEESSDANEPE